MPSTHKKVIVRKHDRDSISGFVSPANFVVEGKLELLNTSGNVVAIDLRDIKAVYFVREFSDTDLMLRKTFTTRPRTEGLWVRLKFKDSDVIEGILPFTAPRVWREAFRRMIEMTDGQIRFAGLASMVVGLILLYLVT